MDEEEDNACVIKLFGSDDIEKLHGFEIGKKEARLIKLLDAVIDYEENEDDGDGDEDHKQVVGEVQDFPLERVNRDALEMVVNFCRRYVAEPAEAEELENVRPPHLSFHLREVFPQWYADFVSRLPTNDLFRLLSAAHYMGVTPLENLVSVPVSNLITWYAYRGELHKLFKVFEAVTGRKNNRKRKSGENDDKIGQQLDEIFNQKLARQHN